MNKECRIFGLEYLADITIVDNDSNTLWHLCVEKHLLEMFHLLVEKASGRINIGDIENCNNTIEWIMGQINELRYRNLSVLQYAAALGDQEFFERILEKYQRKPVVKWPEANIFAYPIEEMV